MPEEKLATEMTANLMEGWLKLHGPRHGWAECIERRAKEAADRGEPTIALWRNPEIRSNGRPASGHVAMVLPGNEDETFIAQAGSINAERIKLRETFGVRPVRFWTHL